MSAKTGKRFAAYATTARSKGRRTLIDCERIVIDMGKDEHGNLLEVSICLDELAQFPSQLPITAFKERPITTGRFTDMPHLVLNERACQNLWMISVKYARIGSEPGQDNP